MLFVFKFEFEWSCETKLKTARKDKSLATWKYKVFCGVNDTGNDVNIALVQHAALSVAAADLRIIYSHSPTIGPSWRKSHRDNNFSCSDSTIIEYASYWYNLFGGSREPVLRLRERNGWKKNNKSNTLAREKKERGSTKASLSQGIPWYLDWQPTAPPWAHMYFSINRRATRIDT